MSHAERLAAHRYAARAAWQAASDAGDDAAEGLVAGSVQAWFYQRDVLLPRMDDQAAASVAVALVDDLGKPGRWSEAHALLSALAGRRLPYDETDAALLFELALAGHRYGLLFALRLAVGAVERLPPDRRAAFGGRLTRALDLLTEDDFQPTDRARLRLRIRDLLAATRPAAPAGTVDTSHIQPVDTWGRCATARLAAIGEGAAAWSALLRHAAGATSGPGPTKTWVRQARQLVDVDGIAPGVIHELLTATVPADRPMPVLAANGDLVRGLIWLAGILDREWFVPDVLAIARAYANVDRKLPNACYATLGRSGRPEAVAALAELKKDTRDRGSLRQIGAALDAAAAAAGLPRSALLERTVADGGLDPGGERRVAAGAAVAVLAIGGAGRVTTRWEVGGERSRRPPAGVAEAHPDAVRAVKRHVTELRGVVAAERERLEGLMIEPREWAIGEWQRWYHEQPVTRRIAERLLWSIVESGTVAAALPVPGSVPARFTRADGTGYAPGPDARIRPWHPITADAAAVRAWRARLVDVELTQPFRQVFRETYALTPAEHQTRLYSNRFAAHILRYDQAYALMKERRWASNYLGPYDGGGSGEGKRDFDTYGIRALFLHDPADHDGHSFPVLFCATDQVRFVRIGDRARQPVPLADVPPAVFSEAMRDVDLFVGVASIAADPAWADRGIDRFNEYWARTAFGALTGAGENRRDVLAQLLPKLRIRDRCRLAGNYLEVTGRRRSYRIHLGSGNVLMSPNDRYLCVIPARTAQPAGVRFLPYEGDLQLNIILSKAFLLADDHKIKDGSIRRQID